MRDGDANEGRRMGATTPSDSPIVKALECRYTQRADRRWPGVEENDDMSTQLKHLFGPETVRSIASDLKRVYPELRHDDFVADAVKGLEDLELLARGWHVAEAMFRYLPQPFSQAAHILVQSLGAENVDPELTGFVPFRYLPHAFYLGKHGVCDPEASLAAQYELTKRFTAEFSIRGLLEQHTELTLARLAIWANDPNVHVRRLVSEGSRPRLPWAPRLRRFQQDPTPVLGLLELLKDDPERYVQRSVANNLNDIGKDHPTAALSVCRRWLEGAGPGRLWIVKHALRSLIKAGNKEALMLMGTGQIPEVKVTSALVEPAQARMGGHVRLRCILESTASVPQTLQVDYVVHFVKSNGKSAPKVFKLARLELEPGQSAPLTAKLSLRPMTTRKLYPGQHRIELQINGVTLELGKFDLES